MKEGTEPTYGDLISQLYEDGKGYAKTRALLYRALVQYRAMQMRLPAVMFMAAVALASAAMMAMLLGLVLTLEEVMGGLPAGLLVGFVALAIAGGLVFWGWSLMPDLDESPFQDDDGISDRTLAEKSAEITEDLASNA